MGIDSWCGQDAHGAKQSILDHLYAIRRHELYGGRDPVPIYIMYEANLSIITAEERINMIKDVMNQDNIEIATHTMKDKTSIPGVWTTAANKRGAVHNLQRMLISDRVHFAHQLISKDATTCKRDLLQQLRVYYEQRFPGTNPAASEYTKTHMSGKTPSGQQDDLACALAYGMWHMDDHLRKTQHFMHQYN